jgi:hypothetical protein
MHLPASAPGMTRPRQALPVSQEARQGVLFHGFDFAP